MRQSAHGGGGEGGTGGVGGRGGGAGIPEARAATAQSSAPNTPSPGRRDSEWARRGPAPACSSPTASSTGDRRVLGGVLLAHVTAAAVAVSVFEPLQT